MNDYLISATAFNSTVDIIAVETTNISNMAKKIHNLSSLSNVVFGNTLTATILMSNFIKNKDENLTLIVNGNGTCGKIVSTINANMEVKGYIENEKAEVTGNTLEKNIGIGNKGNIKVVKDMRLKEPYVGITNIITGDIAQDITYYYNCSEQIMSYLTIEESLDSDNNINRMCGILIQVMPDVTHETIEYLKNNINKLELFKEMIEKGTKLEDMIIYMFSEENIKIKNKRFCIYKCDCSEEKMKQGLISLGKEELLKIIKEDGSAELRCHFCNNRYNINKEELEKMVKNM